MGQVEKNYAGFNDKVNAKTRVAYNAFTKNTLARAGKIKNPAYCLWLVDDWLAWFKDGHIQVYGMHPFKMKIVRH